MGAVTHTHNAHTYPTLTVGRCVCAWVVRDWRQKVLIHPNPHTHTLTVVVVVVVVVAVAPTHTTPTLTLLSTLTLTMAQTPTKAITKM